LQLWNDAHKEEHVVPACKISLANLNLDYVDVFNSLAIFFNYYNIIIWFEWKIQRGAYTTHMARNVLNEENFYLLYHIYCIIVERKYTYNLLKESTHNC